MFQQFKVYIIGAISVIVAAFLAVFQYRGKRIEKLKQDVDTERKNAEAHEEEVKKVITELKLKDKYNEIDKTIIKSNSNTKRDRLSAFNRD